MSIICRFDENIRQIIFVKKLLTALFKKKSPVKINHEQEKNILTATLSLFVK